MELRTASIDGYTIAYSSETRFLVQSRKNGAYKTHAEVIGNFERAWLYYQGINVHSGYIKRIKMDFGNKSYIAKQRGI